MAEQMMASAITGYEDACQPRWAAGEGQRCPSSCRRPGLTVGSPATIARASGSGTGRAARCGDATPAASSALKHTWPPVIRPVRSTTRIAAVVTSAPTRAPPRSAGSRSVTSAIRQPLRAAKSSGNPAAHPRRAADAQVPGSGAPLQPYSLPTSGPIKAQAGPLVAACWVVAAGTGYRDSSTARSRITTLMQSITVRSSSG
jgi:hypothetical protein